MNYVQTYFFPSIANLKCTPSDKQMYLSLGTPGLQEFPHWIFLFHFSATVLYTR